MTLRELHEIFLSSNGISTDSRTFEKGMIYVAIRGRNHDGNAFISDVLRKKPRLVICEEYNGRSKQAILKVKDSVKLMHQLARYHRSKIVGSVIAVTGSNGKTTTRQLIAQLLSKKYKVVQSLKNYNNRIGLALSILEANLDSEFLVLEMGANHKGEIAELCEIAQPDYGLITNIGKAHLGEFGSIEDIKIAKSELYSYLGREQNTAFVDGNESYLLELSTIVNNKIFYNQQNSKEYSSLKSYFKNIKLTPNLTFDYITISLNRTVETSLFGLYNINNIITAITIAEYFDVPESDIADALEEFNQNQNRSQIIQRDNGLIILDAYNANPTSMIEAINNLARIDAQRKCLIMGAMKELGMYSPKEHHNILTKADKSKFDHVIAVGEEFKHHSEGFPAIQFYSKTNDLLQEIGPILDSYDAILIKGSRAYHLEDLVKE